MKQNKKTKNRNKKYKTYLLILSIIIISTFLVRGQPTSPMNVEGYIFLANGEGAENGIPVIINNTNTNQIFTTEVNAPPITSEKGAYLTNIQGNIGHVVIVRAYNDTHYGETTATLTSSLTQINVTMNITRTPELNVTITYPESNAEYSQTENINLTTNITSLIGTSNQCEATITISNTEIIDVKTNYVNLINEILKDETITTIFELEAHNIGTTNMTVKVMCESDGVTFEGKNTDTIYNITVIDGIPPNITIISPENNTEEKATNEIIFRYIVEDHSPINECRLIINGTIRDQAQNVPRNEEQTLTATLENNYYEWIIECDDQRQTGSSRIKNLYVHVYFPIITNINIQEIINLNPGNTKTVRCNATIEDENGANDITNVNATLHANGIINQEQNNNNYYINNSCELITSLGNTAEYSCSFNLQYYANNGTWNCNVTSLDQQGLINNNYENTTIDSLYAINLSSLLMEYGEIIPNEISEEKTLELYNIGNMPLTVFIKGYGGDNPITGENQSMICDNAETIPITNQRYATTLGTTFNDKNQLSSTFQEIINNIEKQTTATMISRITYWELLAEPMSVTNCEGTIVFSVTE